MSEGKNKRVEVRSRLVTPVQVGPDGLSLGRARDLSIGGVGLYSQTPRAAGTCLDLTFSLTLPGGLVRVQARGEVRHCVFVAAQARYRIGVRFIDLDDSARRLIALFVEQRSGKAA